MTFEIQQALEAITGAPGHLRRKRVTVLRVAQAQAAGEPLTSVWSRNGACSKETWYGETRNGVRRPGWRDEPEVQHALELARRRAEWWLNVREGRALQRTLDVIVEAAPTAAMQLARMATQGIMCVRRGETMVEEEVKAAEVVKAINSLLDRADSSTASKWPSEVMVRLSWGEVEASDKNGLSDGDGIEE
ncbi:MAG: hypothetical protein BroJett021_28070 [Chloroflexota bacterium]|nr:MAG: hypothetical protein BroJett021_28070 [Chloroflexota bacterium]